MSKKIFPVIVKRTTAVAVGALNFAGLQNVGVKLNTLYDNRISVTPAVRLVALLNALMPESVGVLLTQLVTGSTQPSVTPGIATNSLYVSPATASDVPAAKIVQITYSLTGTYGASTQTQTGFTNPTNALGLHNGTLASHAGSLTAASSSNMTLNYPSFPNKTDLVISSVTMNMYYSQTGTLAGNGVMNYAAKVGATTVQTATETGNVNFIGAPRAVDLTAAVGGSWTTLATANAVFTHNTPLGTTQTANIDAVELVVVASYVYTP